MSVGMYVRFQNAQILSPSIPWRHQRESIPYQHLMWNVRTKATRQIFKCWNYISSVDLQVAGIAVGARYCASVCQASKTCSKTRVTPNAPLSLALVANDFSQPLRRAGLSRLQRASQLILRPGRVISAHTYVDVFKYPQFLVRNPILSKI